ncbi:hypothetical protein SBRY_100025 [Actinacidiphila bryophytorum]|uniref:Uncharacterized protein n=1 Tax=Actinacidiphila bryophytorum TaxID=1436133 RepID=A0A9W4ECN1_9ACTN|nr:hypothetical protein SBRY_100025 [Actinacidiphila bryophytorum]
MSVAQLLLRGGVGGSRMCVTGHNGMSVTGNTRRRQGTARQRPPRGPPARQPPQAPGQVESCP